MLGCLWCWGAHYLAEHPASLLDVSGWKAETASWQQMSWLFIPPCSRRWKCLVGCASPSHSFQLLGAPVRLLLGEGVWRCSLCARHRAWSREEGWVVGARAEDGHRGQGPWNVPGWWLLDQDIIFPCQALGPLWGSLSLPLRLAWFQSGAGCPNSAGTWVMSGNRLQNGAWNSITQLTRGEN